MGGLGAILAGLAIADNWPSLIPSTFPLAAINRLGEIPGTCITPSLIYGLNYLRDRKIHHRVPESNLNS